ncbi:unnamed protein product [Symbiodinium pilosum]|uniref:Uncharacterized protein n=1 Tax=Symbiodinium pilosum TaxID=2952 RepID=A0A812XFF4_SYMPI|nr:unnamed protein product [Symbiodinium pilosum]
MSDELDMAFRTIAEAGDDEVVAGASRLREPTRKRLIKLFVDAKSDDDTSKRWKSTYLLDSQGSKESQSSGKRKQKGGDTETQIPDTGLVFCPWGTRMGGRGRWAQTVKQFFCVVACMHCHEEACNKRMNSDMDGHWPHFCRGCKPVGSSDPSITNPGSQKAAAVRQTADRQDKLGS